MHIHALRCFGARPGDGNPALVIEDDASPSQARQDFARERDVTCVWIDPASGDGVATLDFYYPHTRSPLCLHATLAAAQILFAHYGDAAPLTVRTAMHGQELGLVQASDALFVRLAPQALMQPTLENGLAARLLRAPESALPGVVHVASVGSPKLLVELRSAADLHALAPDLSAIAAWSKEAGNKHINRLCRPPCSIAAWSKEAGINGLYAYCRVDGDAFEGRNFNHLDPRLEDSATGVAAGALSVLLGRGLALSQGRATGRDCLIRTRIEDGAVLVGGRIEAME